MDDKCKSCESKRIVVDFYRPLMKDGKMFVLKVTQCRNCGETTLDKIFRDEQAQEAGNGGIDNR